MSSMTRNTESGGNLTVFLTLRLTESDREKLEKRWCFIKEASGRAVFLQAVARQVFRIGLQELENNPARSIDPLPADSRIAGRLLRAWRRDIKKSTQEEAAKYIGVSQSMLSRMELGQATPSVATCIRIEKRTAKVPAAAWPKRKSKFSRRKRVVTPTSDQVPPSSLP